MKEENVMTRYVPVCQWCGRSGSALSVGNDKMPTYTPKVLGKCPSHPSGKSNMPHGPRWEKR